MKLKIAALYLLGTSLPLHSVETQISKETTRAIGIIAGTVGATALLYKTIQWLHHEYLIRKSEYELLAWSQSIMGAIEATFSNELRIIRENPHLSAVNLNELLSSIKSHSLGGSHPYIYSVTMIDFMRNDLEKLQSILQAKQKRIPEGIITNNDIQILKDLESHLLCLRAYITSSYEWKLDYKTSCSEQENFA